MTVDKPCEKVLGLKGEHDLKTIVKVENFHS